MINRNSVADFADLIGNLEIAINLDSYKNVTENYKSIKNELLKWIANYYKTRKFDFVSYEKSLEIHDQLDEIKWKILTDKNIGEESLLADNILIRYEVIIKMINKERSENNG